MLFLILICTFVGIENDVICYVSNNLFLKLLHIICNFIEENLYFFSLVARGPCLPITVAVASPKSV